MSENSRNAAIYVLIVKAYLAIGIDKETKAVFDLAEQNKISDYELGIMHLHFRKHYDFIDGYDLEEALVEGHMLIEEMLQNGVCGELLAEMYYALGCLVYCDGRYTNAGEYADWALEICEKPKYYFLKGVDNTSNRKYYYKDALTSLMKVINLKDKWDEELVITLLTQITKMKTTKSGEQAFLDDYKKFACYFKAKIYIKREKYAIAKMSLRIFENAGGSIVPENHRKIIKITKDALKLIKHE